MLLNSPLSILVFISFHWMPFTPVNAIPLQETRSSAIDNTNSFSPFSLNARKEPTLVRRMPAIMENEYRYLGSSMPTDPNLSHALLNVIDSDEKTVDLGRAVGRFNYYQASQLRDFATPKNFAGWKAQVKGRTAKDASVHSYFNYAVGHSGMAPASDEQRKALYEAFTQQFESASAKPPKMGPVDEALKIALTSKLSPNQLSKLNLLPADHSSHAFEMLRIPGDFRYFDILQPNPITPHFLATVSVSWCTAKFTTSILDVQCPGCKPTIILLPSMIPPSAVLFIQSTYTSTLCRSSPSLLQIIIKPTLRVYHGIPSRADPCFSLRNDEGNEHSQQGHKRDGNQECDRLRASHLVFFICRWYEITQTRN
ncbi:hypothetical protein ABKN59_009581 [Abortiporus biennis]